MSSLRAALVACAIVASPLAAAFAHVVSQPNTAVAGDTFTAGFMVGHGCEGGSPTVALRVTLPDGVSAAKPEAKDGWKLTESGRDIEWRGGPLPPHEPGTFRIALKLPDTPGRTLYFLAIQECQQGTSRWIEIPAAGQATKDLHNPAPFLTLTPRP